MSKLISVVIGVDENTNIEGIASILSKKYEADICDIDRNCIFAGIRKDLLSKIKEIKGIVAIINEERLTQSNNERKEESYI